MRLVLLVVCALATGTPAVAAGASIAAWRASFRKDQPRLLGNGAVARAWGNGEWVAKRVMRTGMWMKTPDAAKRAALAQESYEVQEALRNDAGFVARFGPIVPETLLPRAGLLVQRRVSGLTFADLDTRAQLSALTHMHEVLEAAEKIVPGHKLDAFNGYNDNFRFDEHGKVTGWFDATHPEWIVGWKPGDKIGAGWTQQDKILHHAEHITTKLAHTDVGHRAGGVFMINDGYAQRYLDGHADWGPRLLVANPRLGKTFLVHYGFAGAYEASNDPRAHGRPMWEKLGQPVEDERGGGGGTEQRFEHGRMTWSHAAGVQVFLDSE